MRRPARLTRLRLLGLLLGVLSGLSFHGAVADAAEFFVAPEGDDSNPGTREKPFGSLVKARDAVREAVRDAKNDQPINVWLRAGRYELGQTLVFTPQDSGTETAPITYASWPGERVVLAGGRRVIAAWKPYREQIQQCSLVGTPLEGQHFTQLFINADRMHRARFPNVDPVNPLRTGSGYQMVADGSGHRPDEFLAFDPATFTKNRWANPATGVVHAFQSHNWGNMQYRVASVDWDANTIFLGEGGWQLQRTHGIGRGRGASSPFYVENIFEELDAPGEWFLDPEKNILYCHAPEGIDLNNIDLNNIDLNNIDLNHAEVNAVRLARLVEFRGTPEEPVRHVALRGLTITETKTTYLDAYEDLARGDWAVHRGGAIFFEGAEQCAVDDCLFDQVGSNGVFVSGYNRDVSVAGCKFEAAGESAICFVGHPKAVRMYQTWADPSSWIEDMENHDLEPGPQSPDYPADCTASNNIIHNIGIFGKQTAGVFISMSARITASHNTIYEVPRAAICINDGTWGGHVIEHNDIWETVRETGEHGPFNSWGRERFWNGLKKELVLLDAVEPVVIRNNRIANFRKSVSAGNWTIDLDDGSSNYHIHNNLSLGSTLKLRDGYYRKVHNNIHVSPVELGWHCWPTASEDEFTRNIVVITGARPGVSNPTIDLLSPRGKMCDHPWGREMDSNLYWNVNTREFRLAGHDWESWQARGYDQHSKFAEPRFVDPARGDFRVEPDSPAIELGFENFPMDQFGHQQTRIVPFGGEFEESVEVVLRPDVRGARDGRDGQVRYTTDGSEPTCDSTLYTKPLEITGSTVVKACTFDDGLAQGFTETAVFEKVERVIRPSWLETLLAGKWSGSDGDSSSVGKPSGAPKPTQRLLWLGAALVDILHGDQIDALGGIESGVLVQEVPDGSIAHRLGLRDADVIDVYDGKKIENVKTFLEQLREPGTGDVVVEILRKYERIELRVPRIVELPAARARVHGQAARIAHDHVSHWQSIDDWVQWQPKLAAGTYRVEVVYACRDDRAGARYEVAVGDERVEGEVKSTGSWTDYTTVELGTVKTSQTAQADVSVKPLSMPNGAVMNLKTVLLTPVP